MFNPVLLTAIVFEGGKPSGSADENAQSSSSAAGNGAGPGFDVCIDAKSNNEGAGCCGVEARIGEVRAANGSEVGGAG